MLPGFNHNVRHSDRVFHVQTEDNGLAQARLVTQIFISGQLVALERGSYADILAEQLEEKDQTEKIRTRMQEQHKAQMKRLVSGELDDKIEELFGPAGPIEVDLSDDSDDSLVSDEIRKSAENLPTATLSVPEPAHPALQPPAPRVSGSDERASESHPDFLMVLDEEMRRQTPWRPTEEQLQEGERFARASSDDNDPAPRVRAPSKPPAERARSSSKRAAGRAKPRTNSQVNDPTPGTPPPVSAQSPLANQRRNAARKPDANRPRPGAGRAVPRRGAFPPAGDTIVDMGLPAALRESIERRRAQSQSRPPSNPSTPPPHQRPSPVPGGTREDPTPVDIQFRPGRRNSPSDSANDTILEVDAAELRAQVAAQRARLRREKAKAAAVAPPPAADDPKGNIVVVERSLEDVIQGYLSDED